MNERPKDWAISASESRMMTLASIQKISAENQHLRAILSDIQEYADRKGTFGFSELHNILARVLDQEPT